MSDLEKHLPSGGYRLISQYCLESSYKVQEPRDDHPEDARPLELTWDWRITSTDTFEILLGAQVGPSKSAPEVVLYVLVAKFGAASPTSVDLPTFVTLNGPASMVPYLREGISALTARGPFGTYFLPSLNVPEMAKDFRMDETSGGQQLNADEGAWSIQTQPRDT